MSCCTAAPIKTSPHRTNNTHTINSIIRVNTLTSESIPILKCTCTQLITFYTALPLLTPHIAQPAVSIIATFSAVPGLSGRAGRTNSHLQLKETSITHTFCAVKVAIVLTNRIGSLCWATCAIFKHNIPTLTFTSNSIPILILST